MNKWQNLNETHISDGRNESCSFPNFYGHTAVTPEHSPVAGNARRRLRGCGAIKLATLSNDLVGGGVAVYLTVCKGEIVSK